MSKGKSLSPALFSSASDRWFTPPDLLAEVAAFLGTTDYFDPCPATPEGEFIAQDGLAIPWQGRVFCNPPCGRRVLDTWVRKALTEPAVDELILLAPSRTDTEWFHALLCDPREPVILNIRRRLRFSGAKSGAPFPSVLVYIGPEHRVADFCRCFGHRGIVTRPLAVMASTAAAHRRRFPATPRGLWLQEEASE